MTNKVTDDTALVRLEKHLATARTQAERYLSGEALPVRGEVLAIVEADPRAWWEALDLVESFLLFEMSPAIASRAPIDVRANAYCAGVESLTAEWWGIPGALDTTPSQRLIAQGLPVAKCLARLFDSDRKLAYTDGESVHDAKQHGWTVADLAAGLAALILREPYDDEAPVAERAARRAALRARLQ